jgi:hypothetical protein
MAENAGIRDEWIESTVRIQIAATESHEADLEQYVRICEHRIGDGLQISLARFAKHKCSHVCTPWKIIGTVTDVNDRNSGRKLASAARLYCVRRLFRQRAI